MMSVYNVNHIENLYDDFISCKKNFSNDYSDIKSSYIYTSTTSSMKSLEKKLDALYSKIEKGYKNIDTYWSSFINDVKKTEGYLKGSNGTGSIKESAIVSAINKLPKLDTYDAKFSDWFNTLGAKWEKADESYTAKVEEGRQTIAELEQVWDDWLVLLEEDPERALKEGGATVVVMVTSYASGMWDFAEELMDGVVYLEAECESEILKALGKDEKAEQVKTEAAEFIQTSYVDKVNEELYSTDLFKKINDESYIKYDSELAMKIRDASKGFGELIIAGALNCIPGLGQAASAVLLLITGFTSGVGEKAEEVYQTYGTDYDGDIEILLSGVVSAIDFYGKGQITKLVFSAGKSLLSKGATTVVNEAAKNPSFIKALLKNVFDVDNVIDSAAAAANNITYSKEEGWQIDGEAFLKEFGINILITTGTSAVPVIVDAKRAGVAKNVDVNVSSVDDAVDSYKSASKSLTNDEILNLNRNLSTNEIIQIRTEYDEILNKWGDDFDSYKNKVINHGAGDLNKLDEMAKDLKRLEQIEGKLEIPSSKSVLNATENWTSYNKVQADELAEEISQRPIPAMEKYKVDTNSEEYKRAIREIYSTPSPTGTQFLNNANNPFNQTGSKLTLDDLKYSKSKTSQYTAEYLKSNIRKYSYTNTNFVEGLNDSIKANGLYHFTNYSDEILSSGYIKKTGAINSYGTPKTFFFNGVPSAGQMATNLDSLPLTATAVKVVPSDEILSSSKLKVRNLDDGAISFDGNFNLANSQATKEYFCIFKENDELVYKKVTREFYESYPNTAEGRMMQDFLSNKKNIESIRTDYLSEVSEKFAESRKSIKNASGMSDNVLKVDSNSIKDANTYKKIWFDSTDGKTMIEITDDLDPNIVFNHAAYPENVVIRKGNLEFYSDGNMINSRVITNTTSTSSIKEKIQQKISAITERKQVKVFADYNGNLKSYIFDNMPSKLNGVEKSRYIYCKLNNEVSYSKIWNSSKAVSGLDDAKAAIYYQQINLNDFAGQDIVCSNWSNMYSELLTDAGIENYIRGADGGHKWVVFTENGKYYMADATNNYKVAHDLARMQGNVQSGGFIEITKEQFMSNTFANEIAKNKEQYADVIKNSNLDVSKIDKKLGFNYDDAEELFNSGIRQGNSTKELKRLGLSSDAPIEEVIEAKLEQNLFPKVYDMGVLEGYGYSNMVNQREFTGPEITKIQRSLVADATTGEEAVIYRIIGGKSYLHSGKGMLTEIEPDVALHYSEYGYVRIAGR